jgi:hypothetical protein
MSTQGFSKRPGLTVTDIRERLDARIPTAREWLNDMNEQHEEYKRENPTPRYLHAVKEPKHFTPDPEEWRPVPTFSNYEMNYLGHLRYRGSSNNLPWV